MKFLIIFFLLLTFSTNNDLTFDTELFFLEDNSVSVDINGDEYKALYYEPKSNRYFISDLVEVDLEKTNLTLENMSTNFSEERSFLSTNKVYQYNQNYQYAGNLTPYQRVYTRLEVLTNIIVIKTLTLLTNTNFYYESFTEQPTISNKLISTPVPILKTNKYSRLVELVHTNKQGDFIIDYSHALFKKVYVNPNLYE